MHLSNPENFDGGPQPEIEPSEPLESQRPADAAEQLKLQQHKDFAYAQALKAGATITEAMEAMDKAAQEFLAAQEKVVEFPKKPREKDSEAASQKSA